MADELMRALIDARDLAMKNTVAARVPECGDFGAIAQNLDWVVAELESRAAPIAAQLDAEGLPPLPIENFCAWMNGDRADSAFTHAVGDPAIWDKDGYWSRKGYSRAPLYTAEQVRQAQRDAVEPHMKRCDEMRDALYQCKQELAETRRAQQPAQSVDTPKLLELAEFWAGKYHSSFAMVRQGHREAWAALITYIDGRTAGTEGEAVPEGLVHVGTLSVYEDKEASFGHAYDISTNMVGHKALRLLDGAELYAAAPSTQSPTEEV